MTAPNFTDPTTNPSLPTGFRPEPTHSTSRVGAEDIGSVLRRPGIHQLLLGAVLYALVAVAGTSAVWSADEGALLYQVSALADGDGWSFSHPFPEADPAGTRYPLHLSSWAVAGQDGVTVTEQGCPADGVGCRYVSLAKHTTFLWITTGLYNLGGYRALILLSMFGTLATAVAASKLASRLDPVAEIPTLWFVGLGSPLFINAYVAWAHTPTAALVTWAVLWLTGDDNGSRRMMHLIWGGCALAAACLLRTEASLAGLAIGLGWIGSGFALRRNGTGRLPLIGSGIVALVATAGGLLVDRFTATPTDGPVEPPSFDEAFGLIGGRLEGFANTWLRPGYVVVPMDVLLLVSAALLIATAVFVRRGEEGQKLARPTVLLAVACVAVRLLLMPVALVPGLLIACPLLLVGLVLLDRATIRDEDTLAMLVPFVLFCGAVLATQYRGGGGGEWGGRYFAVGLPLGLVVATVGLIRAGRRFPIAEQRQIGSMLVAGVLLLNLLGLFGLREIRNRTTGLADDITLAVTDAGDGDNRPVVVTTMNGLGRWMWEDLDDLRMLRVPSNELLELGQQLAALDIATLTLVSLRPETDTALLDQWYAPDAGATTTSSAPDRDERSADVAGTVTNLGRLPASD